MQFFIRMKAAIMNLFNLFANYISVCPQNFVNLHSQSIRNEKSTRYKSANATP